MLGSKKKRSQTRFAFLPSRQKAGSNNWLTLVMDIFDKSLAISEAHLTVANEEEENSISPLVTLEATISMRRA